jgi:hypothetical protein
MLIRVKYFHKGTTKAQFYEILVYRLLLSDFKMENTL